MITNLVQMPFEVFVRDATMSTSYQSLGISRCTGGRAVWRGFPRRVANQLGATWISITRQFANVKVIDSYRDHPDHVAFANGLFRPITPDRVSIDYELTE